MYTYISSSMHETSIHFYHPGSQSQLSLSLNPNWISQVPSDKVPRQSDTWCLMPDAWRYFSRGENPDTTSHNLNRHHKYPSLPRGCFWVRTPSLNQSQISLDIFPAHCPASLADLLRLGPLNINSWKIGIRQIQLPWGSQKMQFSISNRSRKSQWPHTSYSQSVRLMQQTCHRQVKHSELLFLMKGSPTHENAACESG